MSLKKDSRLHLIMTGTHIQSKSDKGHKVKVIPNEFKRTVMIVCMLHMRFVNSNIPSAHT